MTREFDVVGLARAAARAESGEHLDLDAIGVRNREDYVAFVSAWKAARLERASACREAKREMRLKGGGRDLEDRRSFAQERREALRRVLRDLHVLRAAAKEAAKRRCARVEAA